METIENNNIATGAIDDGTQALQHDAYDVQEFDRAVETYQRLAAAVSGDGCAPAAIRCGTEGNRNPISQRLTAERSQPMAR